MSSQFKSQDQDPWRRLHSRHHSTVLPRHGSNKMESLQNMHTHAVDSAIQLQGDNRVLKKRPPPISDEEQRLNRRQRCILSQLRSGHCHLLQDYKHRVLGEPNDICTDCGASPQDVRHLFACTTHPADLSPEDIWRNPVRSIGAFSYLDNGNLDWLEDGPGRGKQHQQQVLHGDNKRKHYWWLTRQSADRSSTTPHRFGVQTYMTLTTENSNTHRTRLWGSLLDVTRCPV